MYENYNSIGVAKVIVVVGGLLILGVLAVGIVRWQEFRQEAEVAQAEAQREAEEEAQREAAYVAQWQANEADLAAKQEAAKQEEMAAAARLENYRKRHVTVSAAALGHFSTTDFGAGITREHYVAMMCDEKATKLARQTFSKNATGQVVRWLLELSDVQEPDKSESLVADFTMNYSIPAWMNGQNGTSTSKVRVRAVLSAAERERLLTLRRGDWATVEGRLQVEDAPMLLDAKISPPMDAEAPER